jgi:hypothetical protein
MRRHFVAFLVGLGYVALCNQCSRGGNELISVVCGSPTPGAPGSSIVPVTVSMLNGTADFIDMTYTAVDFNGYTVQCNPASSRPRVSKSMPHTDNVVVTYSGTPTFPITITASGTGEAPGGDHEQTTEGLQSGNFGFVLPKPFEKAVAEPMRPSIRKKALEYDMLVTISTNGTATYNGSSDRAKRHDKRAIQSAKNSRKGEIDLVLR